MALVVKNSPAIAGNLRKQVQSLGWEDPLEEEMTIHSSILAWRIPWTEEPGRLQSMRLQRIKHDWSNLACICIVEANKICMMNYIILWNSTIITFDKKTCSDHLLLIDKPPTLKFCGLKLQWSFTFTYKTSISMSLWDRDSSPLFHTMSAGVACLVQNSVLPRQLKVRSVKWWLLAGDSFGVVGWGP